MPPLFVLLSRRYGVQDLCLHSTFKKMPRFIVLVKNCRPQRDRTQAVLIASLQFYNLFKQQSRRQLYEVSSELVVRHEDGSLKDFNV